MLVIAMTGATPSGAVTITDVVPGLPDDPRKKRSQTDEEKSWVSGLRDFGWISMSRMTVRLHDQWMIECKTPGDRKR
jgi:hypothetical protein